MPEGIGDQVQHGIPKREGRTSQLEECALEGDRVEETGSRVNGERADEEREGAARVGDDSDATRSDLAGQDRHTAWTAWLWRSPQRVKQRNKSHRRWPVTSLFTVFRT